MAAQNLSSHNQSLELFNASGLFNISTIFNGSTLVNKSNLLNNYTNNMSEENSDFYYFLYDISWPIMTSLGIVGNTLSSVVLFKLSQLSSFYMYLALLAVSDMAFLINGGIFRWMEMTGIYRPYDTFKRMLCSETFVVTLIFSQLSSWITVAVSIDRYIAVCHPFAVTKYCTRKRAAIYVFVAFVVIAALNLPNICFQWDYDTATCTYPVFTDDYCFKYRSYIDLLMYGLIPFCFIFTMNSLIVRGLYSAAGRRRMLTEGKGDNTSSKTVKDSTAKTVTVLFSITACFLLLFVPFIGVSLHEIVYGYGWHSIPGTLADVCSFLNHAINFILYGLSGQRFRAMFLETFSFRCIRRRSPTQ
ncbi:FMRFamide receptor-like [Argopecten irradians]|uniref:FMRFamide receptor-like n=1 Tax=Argopecten irradians TaxID=31199 RepID=UPI003711E958